MTAPAIGSSAPVQERRRGWAVAVFVLLGLGIGLFAVGRAAATTHERLTIMPEDPLATDDLRFGGLTFDDALADIQTRFDAGTPTLRLPIPGLEAITDLPVDLITDEATDLITLKTDGPIGGLFGAGSPFENVDAELLLLADWNELDAADTDPELVLAVKVGGQLLENIHSLWGGLPAELPPLPGEIQDLTRLADAVISLTPTPGLTTLDPSTLPDVVRDFYGLSSVDEEMILDQVTNLFGRIDLSSMPSIEAAARLLGFDPTDPSSAIDLVGSLSDQATLLFDEVAGNDPTKSDPDAFSLDGPISFSSDDIPDWISREVGFLPEFQFRLSAAPERRPTIKISDTVDIVAGGVPNSFDYEVDLIDARELHLSLTADSFTPPFGLQWMGAFTNVSLELSLSDTEGAPDPAKFSATFDADVPITSPSPRVHIAVATGDGATAQVSVDPHATDADGIPVSDVVSWLDQGFSSAGLDPDAVAGMSLFGLSFSYDGTGNRQTFAGFFDTQLPTPGAPFVTSPERVNATALLAFTDPDTTDADQGTLLAALKVVDPTCSTETPGEECIHLGALLPIPNGSLSADLQMPAVNLVTVQPSGRAFDPAALAGLSARARQFFDEVFKPEGDEPITIEGDLEVFADVPLAPLQDVWDMMGIEFTGSEPPLLRLTGSLGFNLTALTSSDLPSDLTLEHAQLTLDGPSMTLATPAGLPEWFKDELDWPTTGEWRLFLEFTENDPDIDSDDVARFGLSLPGVSTTLLDDPTTEGVVEEGVFSIEASVETTGTDRFVASLAMRQSEDTPWDHPFGIGWLRITGLFMDARLTSVPDDDGVEGSVEIGGLFTIRTGCDPVGNPQLLGITLAIEAVDPDPSATLTLELLSSLTVDDIACTIFPGGLGFDLPEAITSARFGPGALVTTVTPDGVRLGATLETGFTPFSTEIGITLMFAADFTGSEPRIAFGARPKPGLMLSDVLPAGVELPAFPPAGEDPVAEPAGPPIDFQLVPGDPDSDDPADAGFGFVFSSHPFALNDAPANVQEWFAPLFGGNSLNRSVDDGPSVLGAFTLPDPIDGLAKNVGLKDKVFASGNIPLPGDAGLEFKVALGLEVDPAVLPDLVRHAGGNFELTVSGEVPDLSLEIAFELSLELMFKQGFEPGLVDTLAPTGLRLPRAEPLPDPIPDGFTCPRGGLIEAVARDGSQLTDNFCVDIVELSGKAGLSFGLKPTPNIGVQLEATLLSPAATDDPKTGWGPFGLDFVIIRSITGLAEVSFTPTPPAVNINLGFEGNITVLLPNPDDPENPTPKNLSGAFKGGVSIRPGVPPVAAIVTPNFEGVRVAFPQGLGVQDLLDVQTAAAALAGAPSIQDVVPNIDEAIPDIVLRNVEFSFSPFGVKDLCIPLGIVAGAELWLNPTEGSEPGAKPACDPDSFSPDPVPPDNATCAALKEQGCFAGMFFSFTPSGIAADGFLGGFDLYPFPMRFSDTELSLRLTLQQQFLKLSGGVSLGEQGQPEWAGGDLAIQVTPTLLQFFGQVRAFGFNVTADGEITAGQLDNPLDLFKGGFEPNLSMHLVFADDSLQDVGISPDLGFAEAMIDLADPYLEDLQEVVAFLDEILAAMTSGNALNLLLELPARLAQHPDLEFDVPDWLADLSDHVSDFIGGSVDNDDGTSHDVSFSDYSSSLTLHQLLNGIEFAGVRKSLVPSKRTCVDLVAMGTNIARQLLAGNFTEALLGDLIEGKILAGFDGVLNTADDICWSVEAFSPGLFVNPICFGLFIDGKCWLLPPFEFDLGLCAQLFPAAAMPGTPGGDGGRDCTLTEVKGEVQRMFDGALRQVLDFSGISNLSQVLERIRAFFADPASVDLFSLHCAEAAVELSAFGDRTASFGFDSTVFGSRFGLGLDWNFDAPSDSAAGLLAAFWEALAGNAGSGSCSGVRADLYGPESIGFTSEVTLPPLTLTATVAPAAIIENGQVTVTGTFNRELVDADGARTVTIDWSDTSVEPPVPVAIGARSFTRTHMYLDDDPTGTASDVYPIRLSEASGLVATTSVIVRNAVPSGVTATLAAPTINENDVASLTVTFGDAGTLDTHDLNVDWGDGTTTVIGNVVSGRVLSHRYLDDDPTETPGPDTYDIGVSVVDDDRGRGTATTAIGVTNVAPPADAVTLSPATVMEGQLMTFTVGFADVGTLDTHTVEVDWDADGVYDSIQTTRAGQRQVPLAHIWDDDDPTDTPEDVEDVRIRVTDDDGGEVVAARQVTVQNVAPFVCMTIVPTGPTLGETCAGPVPIEMNEGESVSLVAGFSDPGLLDTHTIVIDWGDAGVPDTVLTPPVGTRSFAIDQALGDNGVFTINVTITDDDRGVGNESVQATVHNVDPTADIAEDAATAEQPNGTVFADGPDDSGVLDTPTFLVRRGESLTLSAHSADPGSDDLSFLWDWDTSDRYDLTTTTAMYRVNPPADDPLPSPTFQPRDVTDTQSHSWSQPCLYNVTLAVTDDDSGSAADDTWVVVTGTDKRQRNAGYWYDQYDTSKKKNKRALDAATLACYLEIARHMSQIFDNTGWDPAVRGDLPLLSTATFADAREVLLMPSMEDDRGQLDRQILTTWLNLANGPNRYGPDGWFQVIATPDGDMPVLEAVWAAERAWLKPENDDQARAERKAWKDALEAVNS